MINFMMIKQVYTTGKMGMNIQVDGRMANEMVLDLSPKLMVLWSTRNMKMAIPRERACLGVLIVKLHISLRMVNRLSKLPLKRQKVLQRRSLICLFLNQKRSHRHHL